MYRYFENNNEYRYSDFSGFINEAFRRNKKTNSAVNMYLGDMWDRGRGYIGPVPVDTDDNASEILRNIKRMFTSRNVIEEVVDRQVDALLSRSPDWKIFEIEQFGINQNRSRTVKPPSSTDPVSRVVKAFDASGDKSVTEDQRIAEAEKLLGEVWMKGKVGDALKESLTNRLVAGKGLLRIHLSKLFDKNQDKIESIQDVAKYIKVECVENAKGRVLDDDGEKLSIIEAGKDNKNKTLIEICFVDDNGSTIVASIDQAGTLKTEVDVSENETVSDIITKLSRIADIGTPMFLDGNITADEILGKPFVSESMLQNNRALNLDLSLAVGVLVESGYAEMVTTNVALETKTETDPDDSAMTVQRPVGIKRGAGIVNNLIGEQTVDAEGRVYFEKPSVTFKEPTPLTTFTDGENLYYRQILSEAKQVHVMLNAQADPSGESRVQSRQDFVKKSQRYKPTLDIHGSWVLNVIMHLAAAAAGKDEHFKGIAVIFDSKIYAGELSADEQNVVISRYQNGLVSRETAMVLLGIEDPMIELDLINGDETDKLALQVRRLEATSKFGNMADNGRPPTSELTKQNQNADSKTNIRTDRNKKS